MWTLALVVALQAAAAFAVQPFSWKSCSKPDAPINVTRLQVEPSPLVLPGDMTLTVDGASSYQLSHTSLVLSIKRKTFLGEISIPCLLHVGSCTYSDVCTLIDEMEANNWAGITAGLGKQIRAVLASAGINISQCPQPANQLHLDHASIHLPEVPSVLSFFAAGDYHIHASAVDTATNQEVLCLDLQVSMKQGCSGFSCIFG